MEKRILSSIIEFGNVLLIYAVCRRTIEVFQREQSPLSAWTPTAKIETRTESVAVDERWPPSTSNLSNWRNSACDCFDILHWLANSKAACAAGWEHPTILHLHLARLLLLTPLQHMQALAATSSATRSIEVSENAKHIKAPSHVVQWAIRDHFKARLSIM